jgi:hypothetical protein
MKKLNRLLMVATLVVLLLPAAVVGPVLEACCGVQPIELQVTDDPDPVCLEEKVTISGTYTAIGWNGVEYNTGVVVRIWDPDGNQVVDQNLDLAKETETPKNFTFDYPYLPEMPGMYVYEVIAWADAGSGRMDLSVIGQTFTVEVCNEPPDCSLAKADPGTIWPPNNKFVPVNVLGVTDPDGDALTLSITSIFQDEPVDSYGDGQFTPDGQGVGAATAEVRAERAGTKKVPGDGRCYHIGFSAADGRGGTCGGTVVTCVPHDQNKTPVDGGPLYDSTAVAP